MSLSDISLVFLNYSLGIGLLTCLFKFDKRADSKQSVQKDAHYNIPVREQLCFIMILIINDQKWKHDFFIIVMSR